MNYSVTHTPAFAESGVTTYPSKTCKGFYAANMAAEGVPAQIALLNRILRMIRSLDHAPACPTLGSAPELTPTLLATNSEPIRERQVQFGLHYSF
jgi:hypothetical protein